jgi:hypothetical protein
MDTYTIPSPESGSTAFTKKVWDEHGRPPILILEEGWTDIDSMAFYDAENLLMIRIPASVVEIRENAFMGAIGLHQVVFVENSQLRRIRKMAFSGTKSLERINIPASVVMIGDGAFDNAEGLREVTFEEGSRLEYIGAAAFHSATSLRTIRIPDSVNEFGMVAFSSATSLETFHIPKLVEVLPQGMFMGSTSLREITFDADSLLKTVQLGAFSGATALTKIQIPREVTDIENEAFENTPMLKEITFVPNSQISRIGYQAFKGSGLNTVVVGAPVLARLNAARRTSYMKPLSFGKNNFYGKDNVNIVSMALQINTMRLIAKQTSSALPTHLTNKIGQILTGLTPKRSDLVKGTPTKAKGGTRKRGIRRKSNKRKMKTKKGKSKRRMTHK